jgi:hypothetical protein
VERLQQQVQWLQHNLKKIEDGLALTTTKLED